jgi:predicted NBD/HSP70 family sugar kinase
MSDEASVIAIDIGGGTTKLALVDRKGAIRSWQRFPTAASSGPAFLEKVAADAAQLQSEAKGLVIGVSVAVAGFVSADGALEYNANLPWLERVPIAALLAEELRLNVHIDADSNAACVAEYIFGRGRGSSRFLCLTGGTGLGVGMMVHGKLLRIAHGCMGDAGHIVVSPEGPSCSCGGRGCAEALLSPAYLAKRYAEIGGDRRRRRRQLSIARQRRRSRKALCPRIARRSRLLARHRRSFTGQRLSSRPHRRCRGAFASRRRPLTSRASVLSRARRAVPSRARFAGALKHRRTCHAARSRGLLLPSRVPMRPARRRNCCAGDRVCRLLTVLRKQHGLGPVF